MADAFKPGDTVRLKSGGPVMTVGWVKGDDVECEWFSEASKVERQVFRQEMLVRAEPGGGKAKS